MLEQWVQPTINKNILPPGEFFFNRVPSDKFYFEFLLLRFHWNIRGKHRNPVFCNICYRF